MKTDEISVEVKEIDEVERHFHISVPADQVEKALEKAVAAVRRTARIKGFRKGKAPANMVRKLYSSEIESEAIHSLLDSSYTHVLGTTDLRIVSPPTIDELNFSQGGAFTYKAKVEVLPEVQLGKYKGLKISLVEEQVTPEIIDREIDHIRQSHGTLVPIEPSRPVQDGDFVVIDYVGSVAGEEMGGGKGDGATVEIGKGTFIPGFEEALLGMSAGEEREFDLDYPVAHEEAARNELSGKRMHFKAKVLEIKKRVLPEVNDDFARDLGKFSNLEELKTRLGEELKKMADDRNHRESRQKLLEALIEANAMRVPSAMIERDVDHLLEDTRRTFRSRGRSFPEDKEILGKLRENFRPQAEKRVRGGLLLDAIAKSEGIEITDAELEQYLQKISTDSGKSLEEIRQFYGRGDAMENMRMNLKEEKTLEFLMENAKITKEIRDLQTLSEEPGRGGEAVR